MNKYVFSVSVALMGLTASVALSEMQTWKSTAGTSLQAEFLSRTGNMVALRTADGKTANVNIAALAPESQALIPQQETVVATPTPVRVAAAAKLGPRSVGGIEPPTSEQIAAFKKTFTEPDGTVYEFSASLGPQSLNKKEQSSAFRTGKIPYRITSTFYKMKLVDGKMRSTRMDGSAYIVFLDEAGAVVASKRENLAKLCPS